MHAPIWGYVYDSTVHRLADLGGALAIAHLVEPRIEPEIVFRLSQPPSPGMDDRALLGCVEWVAHGFEVVQSLFPGWCFQAADTVAAFGLHGALAIGEPQPVSEYNVDFWLARLATFETILMCNGAEMDRGHAGNVLGGGPVTALQSSGRGASFRPRQPASRYWRTGLNGHAYARTAGSVGRDLDDAPRRVTTTGDQPRTRPMRR